LLENAGRKREDRALQTASRLQERAKKGKGRERGIGKEKEKMIYDKLKKGERRWNIKKKVVGKRISSRVNCDATTKKKKRVFLFEGWLKVNEGGHRKRF